MIPALIAQIGLPLLVKAVGGALSGSQNSVARAAGEALKEVDGEIRSGRLSGPDLIEANRHLESLAKLHAETDRTWLEQINRTIRAEVGSEDAYVRRMRPTFGYIMALTWAAQMGAVAYVVAVEPEKAGPVIAAIASLGTIWTVGLSVLGIYIYRRSGEKRLAMGDREAPLTEIARAFLVRRAPEIEATAKVRPKGTTHKDRAHPPGHDNGRGK